MTENKNTCGCGCGHDHDQDQEDKIYLTLEDDSELVCDVLGIFEVEDRSYIAMVPEDGDEVFIYEYIESEDGEEFELAVIEDDEEFTKVSDVFEEIFADEYEE